MTLIKTWQVRQAETGIGSVEAKDDEIRELRQALAQPESEPTHTTGRCKEKAKPGGCQLHNLQCNYPECDESGIRPESEPSDREALIAELRDSDNEREYINTLSDATRLTLVWKAANMLEADAQTASQLTEAVDANARLLVRIEGLKRAQQAAVPQGINVTKVIDTAVAKFLGWTLPFDFWPDAGISYDRTYRDKWGMPVGTNLFTALQAKYMFECCLREALAAPQPACVPLSTEAIHKWWASENGLEDCDMCKLADFEKVVRAVEQAVRGKT